MNKDSFRILKEINSLYLETRSLKEKIEQENSRLTKIENLRDEKNEIISVKSIELKELNGQILKTENSLADIQKSLNQAIGNKDKVFTENEIKAFESQIESYQSKLDEYENLGLEQLEKAEDIQQELKDAETFLKGSIDTLEEIKLEILDTNKPDLEKIQQHEQRIEQLFGDVPSELKTKFSALMHRNLKYGPVAQIDKNCCSVCGMEMPSLEIEKVEKHFQFKFCTTCDRLFIPISTLY